jgi:hypothetical protein
LNWIEQVSTRALWTFAIGYTTGGIVMVAICLLEVLR